MIRLKGLVCIFGCAAWIASATPLLEESFDNVPGLTAAGWVIQNNSNPIGPNDWFQGNAGIFPAQSGAPNSYIATNFLAGSGSTPAAISLWLLTPVLSFQDLDSIGFQARVESLGFSDKLEVRLSTNGASANVGGTVSSVGDFTQLLGAVNPSAAPNGFPDAWTSFVFAVSGTGQATGRFALRYVIADNSTQGDYVGVDTLLVTNNNIPEPATWLMLAGGLLFFAARRPARRSVMKLVVSPWLIAAGSLFLAAQAPEPAKTGKPAAKPPAVSKPKAAPVGAGAMRVVRDPDTAEPAPVAAAVSALSQASAEKVAAVQNADGSLMVVLPASLMPMSVATRNPDGSISIREMPKARAEEKIRKEGQK